MASQRSMFASLTTMLAARARAESPDGETNTKICDRHASDWQAAAEAFEALVRACEAVVADAEIDDGDSPITERTYLAARAALQKAGVE